jgi:hypothetical protein
MNFFDTVVAYCRGEYPLMFDSIKFVNIDNDFVTIHMIREDYMFGMRQDEQGTTVFDNTLYRPFSKPSNRPLADIVKDCVDTSWFGHRARLFEECFPSFCDIDYSAEYDPEYPAISRHFKRCPRGRGQDGAVMLGNVPWFVFGDRFTGRLEKYLIALEAKRSAGVHAAIAILPQPIAKEITSHI